jgi:hypothetical protein
MGVGLGRIKVWKGVTLGSGVKVLRGVAVKVGINVNVGTATAVCEAAASAVCAIIRLIELGSVVGRGTGVGREGAQARISVSVMNQRENLVRRVVIDSFNYQGFIQDVQVVNLMSLREGLVVE